LTPSSTNMFDTESLRERSGRAGSQGFLICQQKNDGISTLNDRQYPLTLCLAAAVGLLVREDSHLATLAPSGLLTQTCILHLDGVTVCIRYSTLPQKSIDHRLQRAVPFWFPLEPAEGDQVRSKSTEQVHLEGSASPKFDIQHNPNRRSWATLSRELVSCLGIQ
jgi:hypothetical protein